MDEEKIQKTLEIILNNQAVFSVDIQKVQELNKDRGKRIATLERVSLNLYNSSVEQGKNIAQLSVEVKELRDAQRDAQKETDARLRETDDRLNEVIVMFEKFLDNRNGNS